MVGGALVLLSARGLNALSLGDDVAVSLGERVQRSRLVAAVGAVLLCGAATAIVGPIAFVGLVVPHIARLLLGSDYRWILPVSIGLGAVLLLAADVIGRVAHPSGRHRGRHHHGARRRPGLHRDRAPSAHQGAVIMATTAVLTASDIRSARARRRRRARLVVALLAARRDRALRRLAVPRRPHVHARSRCSRCCSGERVEGAFPVTQLRLPRAIIAALAGIAFGMAGVTFQTMLRNPLASPDIIGITSGASAAAVFGITVLGVGGSMLSLLAVVAGLGTALAIYLLSSDGGRTGTRLVLIGIGVGAMLDAVVGWMLLRAGSVGYRRGDAVAHRQPRQRVLARCAAARDQHGRARAGDPRDHAPPRHPPARR